MNNRQPQAGDTVEFIPRASNTMPQGGGMALMDQATFLGWVRQYHILQITNRMAQVIPVRGVINSITRTYNSHDNNCLEGRVDVF